MYDDRGAEYKVPEWLVIEPAGIVEEEEVPATDNKNNDTTTFDEAELDSEFVVRVRVSQQSQDLNVTIRKRENIASIREKLKALAQVCLHRPMSIVTSSQRP